MLSSKFKQLHIVDGYKFRFQKTLANGVQRWLCSNLQPPNICERPSKILHKTVSSQDLQLLNQRDVQYILKNAHNARACMFIQSYHRISPNYEQNSLLKICRPSEKFVGRYNLYIIFYVLFM
uniref:Uncharacterized protein n=1 Tax=Cacopsylla melanoneura TaxID=428564 RepID=A0A8D8PTJ9_9HEMI